MCDGGCVSGINRSADANSDVLTLNVLSGEKATKSPLSLP